MNEPLPREPNPENIPGVIAPHGPLTLTTRGYLLLAAGAVIVLMMAYGSCHRPDGPYGPQIPSSRARELGKLDDRADKARREYEDLLKQKQQSQRVQPRESEALSSSAAPQKTARQLQAEDLEKRLHDAAYAVPLVTDAPARRTDDRVARKPADPVPAARDGGDPKPVRPTGDKSVTLPAGTILNAETVNMLDGSNTGPLVAMLTRDVYAPDTQRVVVPQGAKLFGEASRVSSFDQERLTITFHSLAISPTHSVSLDKLPGLDQEGATGLHDQVNRHYAQIFGVSMAIGALGGLAQIGNGSYGGLEGYDASTQLRNGITNSFATSAGMVLNRFLQRMPTIRIRPGQRVDILLMDPLKIPDVLE